MKEALLYDAGLKIYRRAKAIMTELAESALYAGGRHPIVRLKVHTDQPGASRPELR